jgi:SAM-dependent methyltransferase
MRPAPGDGWNHNVHYHELLLRAAPRPCRRALDAGCGTGAFARRLAGVAGDVDAIDRDPSVLARARAHGAPANLRFAESDFLAWPGRGYDFIALVAVLHHLPFVPALTRARDMLAPGGVLAVLGLDRAPSLPHQLAQAALAFPVSHFHRWTRPTCAVDAPIADPAMTLAEIRREAAAIVPGAAVRRHLLWRYSLVWTRPATD